MSPKGAPQNTPKSGPKRGPKGRFQPGQSGNPGGRPKRTPVTEALRDYLACHPQELQSMIRTMVERAKGGDVRAFIALSDRLDGRPAQQLTVDAQLAVVRQQFERMSDTELQRYAETGALPAWFDAEAEHA